MNGMNEAETKGDPAMKSLKPKTLAAADLTPFCTPDCLATLKKKNVEFVEECAAPYPDIKNPSTWYRLYVAKSDGCCALITAENLAGKIETFAWIDTAREPISTAKWNWMRAQVDIIDGKTSCFHYVMTDQEYPGPMPKLKAANCAPFEENDLEWLAVDSFFSSSPDLSSAPAYELPPLPTQAEIDVWDWKRTEEAQAQVE